MKFTTGDTVKIVTINRGGRATMREERRPPKVETWMGKIMGHSPMGGQWWLVRKMKRGKDGNLQKGKGYGTYTVPEHEITKAGS